MYCLEKFQRELAYFFDVDLRDLPKVQEILQSQGYTAIKKNDEIIELGNGKVSKEQVEKLKEVVESGDKAQSSVSKVDSSLDISPKAQYDKGVDSSDIIFTDTKGKEHTLTKEVQQQWLETFNLKNLDDTFIPSIPQEVREAIGKDIKVNFKDLLKLVENGREKYIPQIRETFSKPEAAFIDEQNDLIFARTMTDNLFFVNVSRDYGENFLNVTLSPKKHNTLLNKLKNAKEVFIDKVSPELRDSSAHKASTDFLSSTSRDTQNPTTKAEISKELESKSTIPQTTQEIIKQAKASGKSVKETKELIQKNKELQEHKESTPQKVDNSTSQSLAQTNLSPSAQAKKDEVLARIESKKALQAKQAKQIYEFFTAKGTNKDKIKTLENFADFMIELNKKLDRKWQFLEQQTSNDLAKYKQILTEGIEQAQQARRISPSEKQRALQDLDLLIDNFSYIEDTRLYSFHPSKVSEILHKIQYKAYDLEDLSNDEFMKILFDKKLPKALYEDFEREFSKRKYRIYPFLKPMLAKDNSFEHISEQNLKDFFYKGVLRDEAIPEMIAKERGVKIQDLSIAKIQDFRINSPRQNIEQALEIKPLSEFGTNYAEFYRDGQGAVKKLLAEKQGQVASAFYRDDLAKATGTGEIDLVWGDSNFGLRHILEQRAKQWGEEKALKFISHLSENIEKGQIVELEKGRVGIKTDLTTIILDKKENNNFVLTAFRDRNNKKELESLNLSQSKTFTSENAETNAKESPVTPLNQESIIPQRSINLAMEKFHYDEAKAKDLLEWHKDSSPLTKNEDGTPKVFYHGTRESIGNKEILTPKHTDDTGQNYPARFFSSSHNVALSYTKELPNSDNGIYKVFLNAKNPLVIDFQGKDFVDRSELADKIYKGEQYFDLAIRKALDEAKESGKPFDSVIYKNVRDERYGRSKEISDTIAIFNPNQIKHIDNKGSWTDSAGKITQEKPSDESAKHSYFNAQSPNILQSNPHLGAGLVGGMLNGLETDEDGNITGFDPEKFAMGFLGGAVGSKAVSMGFKHLEKNPALKEKIITELADTLAQGFDKAREKYPLLSMLEPRYIIQNERGRKIQAKAMLKELEKQILDDEKINLTKLKAQDLPKADFKNIKEFKDKFTRKSGKYGVIKTPYKDVRVNIAYAYTHFYKNTYNVNRNYIKGAFFDVLQNPLFIAEKETNKGLSTYFYKVYKHKNNQIGIFGIGVNKYGEIEFKTMYEDKKLNRIKEILKLKDENIKYVSE
ncbi:Uncharacterised protein [Helicobacter fennelliae]|uniref:Uncharacterized protein n=1 Tax=Helicobacter fennelliae TaxID=215 RepID=A0A2X3BTP1_9HELI|nr:hypothetical protein [Helicobacter fennelliae]SQB99535.1 Uncharacterised protein [Helicobacter fennelliae]